MTMALENVKIADLTAYIAGSYMCTLLSDLGAKVTKVEGFDGDGFRPMAGSFIGWNRGKRAAILNLQTPDGREAFYDMVRQSDVVTENSRPGLMKRLGVDYESIRKIKPDIVYVSMPGWGTKGPHEIAPGWDPLIQGYSGQMLMQSGYGNAPVFHRVAINDYQCAMLGVLATCLGVFHKKRTGQGQLIQTSLINAAVFHDAYYFMDYQGRKPANVGADHHKGEHPALRLYKGKDYWFLVACYKDSEWQTLCNVIGLPELAVRYSFADIKAKTAYDYDVVGAIQAALLTRTADEWVDLLETAGVPCAPGHEYVNIFTDPHVAANELVGTNPHPRRGDVTQLGPTIKMSLTPTRFQRYAPVHGEDTIEVLRELGYSEEKIKDLLDRRVVGQQGVNITNQL